MNVCKLCSIFFLVLFLSSHIYSEGFFDRTNNFNYYVNNTIPEIEVHIKIPTDNLIVRGASLRYNGVENYLDLTDEKILVGTYEHIVEIKLSDFSGQGPIESEDDVYFELDVVKDGTETEIETDGEPVKFNIILDTEVPKLLNYESNNILVSKLDEEFSFKFSEKISEFKIIDMSGKLILKKPSEVKFYEDEYSNIITFKFGVRQLIEGNNNYIISFSDLAGNKVKKEINFASKGDELNIKLLTRKDDSSLKYFYDMENSDFFGNKIQFMNDEYDLVIETNKKANCYFSSSFTNFVDYKDLLSTADYSSFSSSDNLKHTYSMSGQTLVWIACQDLGFPDEVVYLNKILGFGNELVRFEKYILNFEILKFYPQVIVSNRPFDIEVHTSQNTICSYDINNGGVRGFLDNSSIDYKKHTQGDIDLIDGSHNIKVECYDKVYNVKSEIKNVLVDTTSGPRVIGEKEFYSDSKTTSILLQFSEDAECVSSKDQIDASGFNSSTPISGTGLEKIITPSDLEVGKNDYYIYCKKGGQLISSKIEILFDPAQPTIKDLVFVNNEGSSEYLVDDKKISYKIKYEGLIPVDRYEVKIEYSNFTIKENYSKRSGVYLGDISNAKKFKIKLVNILDKTSNELEKTIKFDLEAPIVSIRKSGSNKKITCVDDKSGCKKVYYGFSQTAINCNANTIYVLGEEIVVGDNSYICARAIDFVGNEDIDQVSLFDGTFGFDGNQGEVDENGVLIDDSGNNIDNLNNDNGDTIPKNDVDDNPFTQTSEDESTTSDSNGLIIAAAIIVLLGGIGGGGYYAYREGYLDKQLEKFGIFRKSTSSGVLSPSAGISGSSVYTPISKTKKGKNDPIKKTGYDRNLKKINSFIDDTLSQGDDVFDSFSSTSKGKTKGYDDTLLKGTSPKKKSQEFSLNKNNGISKDSVESIEKQAEEFENYFKEKGSESNDKKEK
jgi:hypothetical protein